MSLTLDAVLALAPDASSAKAAQGLLSPSGWPQLGASAAAVWGACQGSGSKPYQTQVDLGGPAFRCTCPSRKFPCKHGLALLMLRVQNAALFKDEAEPGWVSEWLATRGEKAQKKEERQAAAADKPVAQADPEAAAAREAQRWQRIEAAAGELQRWLADQIGRGLGALNAELLQTWATMAARLVDAQAPGLAQRVRDAADSALARDTERTLHHLGLLQLACEALQRRTTLGPALQAELRTVAGWPHDRAEVLAAATPVTERWTVLGMATELRDAKLTERRVWLQGEASGRRAWLLDHAFAGRGFEQAWLAGSSVVATLAPFPGTAGLRMLCAGAGAGAEPTLGPPLWPATTLAAEWQQVGERCAASPWVTLHPLVLPAAVVVQVGGQTRAVCAGRALRLLLGEADTWALLAATGGLPVALMGEWDGVALRPLTAWTPGQAAPLWLRSSE